MKTQTNTNSAELSTNQVLINKILKYEHPALVEKLQQKLGISNEEALELFNDTKRFLFLCGINNEVFVPTGSIDEGWHHFILYTKDYVDFCQENFGRFIHHKPDSSESFKAIRTTLALNTFNKAKCTFGNLSKNWEYLKLSDCIDIPEGECEGSSSGVS